MLLRSCSISFTSFCACAVTELFCLTMAMSGAPPLRMCINHMDFIGSTIREKTESERERWKAENMCVCERQKKYKNNPHDSPYHTAPCGQRGPSCKAVVPETGWTLKRHHFPAQITMSLLYLFQHQPHSRFNPTSWGPCKASDSEAGCDVYISDEACCLQISPIGCITGSMISLALG